MPPRSVSEWHWLQAVGIVARSIVGAASVPPRVWHVKQSRPRNVVFVITESVRAQSVCVAYDPKCRWTPFSNEAAPNRIPLTQMRALDSTTAISLAIMWGGHMPTAPPGMR